ncbi:hypothetical protein PR048_000513 [Dryococelus australis]|uniref:Uncharacterized protein n=1 Tax=Dryococelus australis TaxID=614101 RepID=A0ABQ9IEU1_9NEOP|nr:hypothetical protein PR048_000513 [Dryococelus australis]
MDIKYTAIVQWNTNAMYCSKAPFRQWLARSPTTKVNQVRLLVRSIAEFSHMIIMPDDAAGRWVFSGISSVPPPLYSSAAPFSPRFILIGSQDLMLRVVQIPPPQCSFSFLAVTELKALAICSCNACRDNSPQRRAPLFGYVLCFVRITATNVFATDDTVASVRAKILPSPRPPFTAQASPLHHISTRLDVMRGQSYEAANSLRWARMQARMFESDIAHGYSRDFEINRLEKGETILQASCVYATRLNVLDTLRDRIAAGRETIRNTPGLHQRILESMQRWVEACVLSLGRRMNKVVKSHECEAGPECEGGETRDPRKNPPTSGIAQHDRYVPGYVGSGIGKLQSVARFDCSKEFMTHAISRSLELSTAQKNSDTGDNNTHAQRPIAPTRKACSVYVVTPSCAKVTTNKMIGSPLKNPKVHAARREHCTPVQRLALRGDVALAARVSIALIARALPCLKRAEELLLL